MVSGYHTESLQEKVCFYGTFMVCELASFYKGQPAVLIPHQPKWETHI